MEELIEPSSLECVADSEQGNGEDSIDCSSLNVEMDTPEKRIDTPEKTVAENGRRNKLRKLYNLPLPPKPTLGLGNFTEVDLTAPEDGDPKEDWLKQRFPMLKKEKKKTVIAPTRLDRETVKTNLLSKLAARRKAEQEKRRELYREDNEDILGAENDEEEEEYKPVKKPKKRVTASEDYDEEEDEDYVAYEDGGSGDDDGDESCEGEEESEDDEEEAVQDEEKETESVDTDAMTDSVIPETVERTLPIPYSMSTDLFESPLSSFPSQRPETNAVVPDASQPSTFTGTQFPGSLSQWFAEEGSSSRTESAGNRDEIGTVDEDDLLALCSGPQGSLKYPTFPDAFADATDDDLLALCSGQFDFSKLNKDEAPEANDGPKNDQNDDDPEDIPASTQTAKKKKKNIVESDDEGDNDENDFPKEDEGIEGDDLPETVELQQAPQPKRTVVVSDDEDEDFISIPKPCKANADYDKDEEEEEMEADDCGENEEEVAPTPTPRPTSGIDGDEEEDYDSDDELAVHRKLQMGEYSRKAQKETFFDDEASLSGDDVGSDLDEDVEENDEYEREEGDDEVFDEEELRRQNHKRFLKDQERVMHKEIAELQQRLLADGDLAGVETNRTFRIKLREEAENTEADADSQTSQDTLEVDDEEEAKARAEALKLKLQRQELLASQPIEDYNPEDDPFESAAAAALSTVVDLSQEPVKKTSLLERAPLGNIFKELSGNTVAKQLYTRTDVMTSTKRKLTTATTDPSKKPKLSLLNDV